MFRTHAATQIKVRRRLHVVKASTNLEGTTILCVCPAKISGWPRSFYLSTDPFKKKPHKNDRKRSMLDPEADEMDGQTDTEGLY